MEKKAMGFTVENDGNIEKQWRNVVDFDGILGRFGIFRMDKEWLKKGSKGILKIGLPHFFLF